MGWAGGAAIAEDLWKTFRNFVPEVRRRDLAKFIIERFEEEDADTMYEAETLMTDAGDCRA